MSRTRFNLFNESSYKINLPKLKLELIKIFSLNLSKGPKQIVDELDIALVLSDSARLLALNQKYAGKNKTTDVLSFMWQAGKGDIFINLDLVKQQVIKQVFTHGLLHILGFDHKTAKEEKEMNKAAEQILKQV